MSEMVVYATALPKIFLDLYPEGQVRVRIDGKTTTLQPTDEQPQEFPWLGMFAHLPRSKSGELPSEEFARRKQEEKELEL